MSSEPGQIYALLAKVMGEIGPVPKDQVNQQQKYPFRGIDTICNAVNAVLSKNGVVCVPAVLNRWRDTEPSKQGGTNHYTSVRCRFTFYAPDGSHVEAVTIGEGMDSGDKSSNKAMTSALKNALTQVLCLATHGKSDGDTDGNGSDGAAPVNGDAAFAQARTNLILGIEKKRKTVCPQSALSHLGFYRVVCQNLLGKEEAETVAELDKVRTTLRDNKDFYDWASGTTTF